MKFCELCECNPCDCEDKDRPAKEHTFPQEGFRKGVRIFDARMGVYVLWVEDDNGDGDESEEESEDTESST